MDILARGKKSSRISSREGSAAFKKQYNEAELRRRALIARLNGLNAKSHSHPAHKRALTLLGQTFRHAPLPHRFEVLKAAEWLINLLEALTIRA